MCVCVFLCVCVVGEAIPYMPGLKCLSLVCSEVSGHINITISISVSPCRICNHLIVV